MTDINGMAKSIKLIIKELAEYTAYTGLLRIDGVDAVREAYDNIDELVRLADVGQAVEIASSKGAILAYDIQEDCDGNILTYNCDSDIADVLGWGQFYVTVRK